MFKKIEIWILYLVILLSLIFSIFFGILVRQELVGENKLGNFSKFALFLAEIPKNIRLAFVDFHVITNDRFPSMSGFIGNTLDKEVYLLMSRYDGDIRQGVVELIDLRSFETLHTWNPDINILNSLVLESAENSYLQRDNNDSISILRHPQLTADGGLLFLYIGPLRKVNHCSKLIWQNSNDIFHHSIELDLEGNIWSPTHVYPQTLDENIVGRKLIQEGGFFDDAITKVNPEGSIIYQKSISEIFLENNLDYLLFSSGPDKEFTVDPIHLNDIQPANFDTDHWKKGDIFLSLRHQSMVMLFRPSSNKLIWYTAGRTLQQHDVNILNEHEISIFNNNSKHYFNGPTIDGSNEVVIYNFQKETFKSYFQKQIEENKVQTITQGRSEILPDGSMFLEETNSGRSLYFDKNGALRWYHINRARNKNIYSTGWSRILYKDSDLKAVQKVLELKRDNTCS
ncbi:MAG: arylsulfotransferase family protein [Gammaproteobacteria bacterium]